MPVERIEIGPMQMSGHSALAGAAPVAINVVIDGAGAVSRRPGIAAHPDYDSTVSTEPVIGLHVLPNGEYLTFAGNLPGDYDVSRVASTGLRKLADMTGSSRPVTVETEAAVMWSDGRRPNMVNLKTLKVESLGPNPPQASHLVANSSRILANDVVRQVTQLNYTAPSTGESTAGHEVWNDITNALGTASFVSAEANPEPVVALAANSNEVFAFKKTVATSFVPDASAIFSPASTREVGCSAPYSIISDDSAFAWIDQRRRIVHSDMRSVAVISDPIQRTLDEMVRVDDAWGFRFNQGYVDALVWQFPTDGRTFAYQKEIGWGQWMGQAAGMPVAFPVSSHVHDSGRRLNVVGTSDGQLGILTLDSQDDLGEPIGAHVQTGYISHETSQRKTCVALRVALERAKESTENSTVGVSWRSDGESWEGPIHIGMGKDSDRATTVELRSLGVYRRRQWRFSFHGPQTLTVASVEEEFQVLGQ